jgi:hypothetical protein
MINFGVKVFGAIEFGNKNLPHEIESGRPVDAHSDFIRTALATIKMAK